MGSAENVLSQGGRVPGASMLQAPDCGPCHGNGPRIGKDPLPGETAGWLFPSTHPHPGLGQAGEREGGQAERQPLGRGEAGGDGQEAYRLQGAQSSGPRALVAPAFAGSVGAGFHKTCPPAAPSTAAGSTEAPGRQQLAPCPRSAGTSAPGLPFRGAAVPRRLPPATSEGLLSRPG